MTAVPLVSLETERLVVRPYGDGDAAAYLAACLRNREHLHPFEQDNPAREVQTVEDVLSLFQTFGDGWTARRCLFLGAWERSGGEFAAQMYVGVTNWSPARFELGYWVDAQREGRGYVTEAARAVVEWLFDTLNAVEVRIGCNELNVRSQRVAERLQFSFDSHHPRTRPHLLLPDGSPSGDYEYSLSRSDFEHSRALAKAGAGELPERESFGGTK